MKTLLNHLFKQLNENEQCYVIIDGAKYKKLDYQLTVDGVENYTIPMYPEDADKLEEVAPYLIQMEEDHPFITWVIQNVYGDNGAIFLHSPLSLYDLSEHLTSYIYVTREVEIEGRKVQQKGYLAYYDPRVFPEWIESIEKNDQTEFCSPISKVYCEDFFDKKQLIEYSFKEDMTISYYQLQTKGVEDGND